MATTLQSPGVNVSVIDESFYTPSAPGTVPTIFVATAANKANASGTGTAQGTIESNVGKVWVMTSQRDLTDTFGTPKFYTDASGNPVHGGELNEYGLQAAYSVLGVSSKAYVVRANVDLASLSADTSIPTGNPVAGTYWLDTAHSLFGINEWDATSKKFTVKTPLIIDDSNSATVSDNGVPLNSFGAQGDYAVVLTKDNGYSFSNAVYYKNSSNNWNEVQTQNDDWSDGTLQLAVSPHYQYPDFSSAPTGSVWIKTTTPGYGADLSLKYYNGATKSWTSVSAPYYSSTAAAIGVLDKNGGRNIPVNTVIVEFDPDHYGIASTGTVLTSEFKIWRRNATGSTTITVTGASTAITQANSSDFTMRATNADGVWSEPVLVTIDGSTTTSVAYNMQAAISAAGLNVNATYDQTAGSLSITHTLGGEIEFTEGTNNPLETVGFNPYDIVSKTGTPNFYYAPSADEFQVIATNWKPLIYQAQGSTPVTTPADGTLWYDANLESVDILYNNGTQWVGYKDSSAFPLSNATGPIVSSTKPTTQTDGNDLVDGDIWIDLSDVEMYGKNVYVFNGDTQAWDLQDVTDHHSPNGWVFHDARWSGAGDDVAPDSTVKLLTYNYVDPDCVDPALYPKGTRLWNTRRSGFTVKEYMTGYIDTTALNTRYENDVMTGYNPDRWVSVTPLQADGSGTFGRHAQRAYVVSKLKSEIDSNLDIRDTDTLTFNLLACPGYPETIQNLVNLNTDIGQSAFVVGDTSMRLEPTGTALSNYGNNTANASDNGETALVTHDTYMSAFYPSGYTTDNAGNYIVVPPSHMMLRTIINSDAKSYPWFAPAGTRRGGIDNASAVGYVDSTGAFKPVSLYEGLRDVMSTVHINPISTLPGVGIVNMGQYTRSSGASALDRINVARLTAYLRRQLTILAKPFLFEPNDQQTRNEIKAAATSLLLELVGQRAIYDFLVVCDSTNNTPARIDRSELYMDIAIEPVKAVEFIYIPLRLVNTGAISSGNLGSTFKGSTQ
jgi:Phage tail sheath C-terminal domain